VIFLIWRVLNLSLVIWDLNPQMWHHHYDVSQASWLISSWEMASIECTCTSRWDRARRAYWPWSASQRVYLVSNMKFLPGQESPTSVLWRVYSYLEVLVQFVIVCTWVAIQPAWFVGVQYWQNLIWQFSPDHEITNLKPCQNISLYSNFLFAVLVYTSSQSSAALHCHLLGSELSWCTDLF